MRALARWVTDEGRRAVGDRQPGAELLRALGITDPRRLGVDRLWAESRGRGDPLGDGSRRVKPSGELQHVILRAKTSAASAFLGRDRDVRLGKSILPVAVQHGSP